MPSSDSARPQPAGESPSVARVRAALAANGLDHLEVRTFAERTATAADAAAAIGTSVDRIVKSLVFLAADEPVLVLVAGPNRADVDKIARLTGHRLRRASADQVRGLTGFAIGGVPPVGFSRPFPTLIDRDLLAFDEVWAAAGTPNSVFAIQPTELVRVTNGRVADVAQDGTAG
jgi:prolyl-tRNA editing enzyme YbaK/EbsC (Cys-tRNA(Pro) deacylase)